MTGPEVVRKRNEMKRIATSLGSFLLFCFLEAMTNKSSKYKTTLQSYKLCRGGKPTDCYKNP